MTTKDVIKQLPIEDKLKTQILNMYDHMEPAQKLTIQRIAWKTYDLMREERIEENVQQGFENVSKGEGQLGKDFYDNVVKKTDQEMVKDVQKSIQATDLAAARQAMEQIINEIGKSKKKN